MKIVIYTLLVVIGLMTTNAVAAQEGSLVVIVNKDNTAVTEMSSGQIKLYFLKKIKIRWPKIHQAIKPVDHEYLTPTRKLFYSKVLRMSPEDVGQYYVSRQISNAIKPPQKVISEQDVIDFVMANVGAIGYVNREVYETNKNKVKMVLMVNE